MDEKKRSPIMSPPLMVIIVSAVASILVVGLSTLLMLTGILVQENSNVVVLIYRDDLCVHGVYCPFCQDVCICFYGWEGETCNEEPTRRSITNDDNDEDFYPIRLWNKNSQQTLIKGNLDNATCRENCLDDPDCKGYFWDPCDSYIDICIPECVFIIDYSIFNKPVFITTHERFLLQNETITTTSQEWLYLKRGVDCLGAICHYNDDYGIVFVDDFTHDISQSNLKTQVENTTIMNGHDAWYDEIINEINTTLLNNSIENLDNIHLAILEISNMPFLHLKRIVPLLSYEISSMTLVTTITPSLVMIPDYDFDFTYEDNEELIIKFMDYSRNIIDNEEETYDLIILTLAMYGQSNIPKILTNAYNLLKQGGIIIIRDQYLFNNNGNELPVSNPCMGAGLPYKKFVDDYLSLFAQISLYESPLQEYPLNLDIQETPTLNPLPFKNSGCWGFHNETHIHPEYYMRWFTFVGTK